MIFNFVEYGRNLDLYAILDGVVPNEHDAAYAFMLRKAEEIGLKPAKK